MRGLELYLERHPEGYALGVQDAGFHSRSGWGAAYLCSRLDVPCFVVYPVFVDEGTLENHTLREYQQNALDLGAHLLPVKAGRATVTYHQGKRRMMEITDGRAVMLPPGLKLPESAVGTGNEARHHTPPELRKGTWIISISSGTVGSGVIQGMAEHQSEIDFVCHFGSTKNRAKTRAYMVQNAGYVPDSLKLVEEGYDYSDAVEEPVPFPASPWYEAKAWRWLRENIQGLRQPIIFWNIGT
jgi:hypothetical protein